MSVVFHRLQVWFPSPKQVLSSSESYLVHIVFSLLGLKKKKNQPPLISSSSIFTQGGYLFLANASVSVPSLHFIASSVLCARVLLEYPEALSTHVD